MKKIKNFFCHRFGPVVLVCTLMAAFGLITRLVLFFISVKEVGINPLNYIAIFLVGFLFDVVAGLFFAGPVALYCWLMKDSWYKMKWNRIPLFIYFFLITLIFTISSASEITFWLEFNSRFNFIAVDYLVYRNEVLGNIWESYNVPVIMSVVIIVVLTVLILIRKKIIASQLSTLRFSKRTIIFFVYLFATTLAYFGWSADYRNFSNNRYINELSGNGPYLFGAAFWNNELDYNTFYATRDMHQNFKIVREALSGPGVTFTNDSFSIERKIFNGEEKKYNVVLITVESLSGDYMKYFGGDGEITPYLDSLIPKSLFFENFYASGTRTVRGLEAVSLAIPPTPGQSIVRRPNNEDMFTMGSVLKGKGYDVNYIYGGNSFFDNMGYFFGHSSYNVIDERDIPADKKFFKTVWGVADEILFDQALQTCDKSFKENKPFFNHVMTVSNHRPYTFPDGRIDKPSANKSFDGAVKYSDYSINRFLKMAQTKPWFNNTIFIIVSDHCASSAGKTDLPVNRYHIPCIIYAPEIITPKIESRFTSQIDLAPTVLGLLNLNYTSRFMGYDINRTPLGKERIFISTYQEIGFIKHDTLVALLPNKAVNSYKVNFEDFAAKKIDNPQKIVDQAIAWYQTASYLFRSNGYKELKK